MEANENTNRVVNLANSMSSDINNRRFDNGKKVQDKAGEQPAETQEKPAEEASSGRGFFGNLFSAATKETHPSATEQPQDSSAAMTPERLNEIINAVNKEDLAKQAGKSYKFDDKVLRLPADYSGYESYWDKDKDEDQANKVEIRSVLDDVRAPILMAEGSIAGGRPAWLEPVAGVLVLMLTNDGYLEEVPVGPPVRCIDKNSASSIITQFSTLPLEQIHHFAYNGEYMNALFKDRKLVDILIHIEDRTFYGHRCILCAHSGYFSSVLVDSSVPPYAITDITLKSIHPEQFKRFLNFIYTGELLLTLANVESLRNLANKLKSKTLRAKIAVFLSKSKTLTLDEALEILLQETGKEEFLRPLAMETIVKYFKVLLLDPGKLCQIAKEDLLYILQADSLNVDSELDAFWGVLYWVAVDPVERAPAMNRLMSAVRFTTMSSLELMDCARVSELVRLSKRCQAYLLNANWVCHVREVGLQDPLGLNKEQKRSSLSETTPHEPTVAEFDMRFLIYNALLHDRQGRIVEPMINDKRPEGPLHGQVARMNIPSRGSILNKRGVTSVGRRDEETAEEPAKEAAPTGEVEQTEAESEKEAEQSSETDQKDTEDAGTGGEKEARGKKGKKRKKRESGDSKRGLKDVSENRIITGNNDDDDEEEEESTSEMFSASKSEATGAINDDILISFDTSPATVNMNNISSSALQVSSDYSSDKREGLDNSSDRSRTLGKTACGKVDALQLWEKCVSGPSELLVLGGDILQPRRSCPVSLTRSRFKDTQSGHSNSSQISTSIEVMGASHPRSSVGETQSNYLTRGRRHAPSFTSADTFGGDDDLSTADTSDQVTFPELSDDNPPGNFDHGGTSSDSSPGQFSTSNFQEKRFRHNSSHRQCREESKQSYSRASSNYLHDEVQAKAEYLRYGQADGQNSDEVTSRIRNTSSLDDPLTLQTGNEDLINF